MRLVTFVLPADPHPTPRAGAILDDDHTLVDLQAAHFAMYGAPNPRLSDPEAFGRAGRHARHLAERVADWARTQNAPGTTVSLAAVRLINEL